MPFSRDNDRYYWYCSTSRAVSEMVPYKQRILAYIGLIFGILKIASSGCQLARYM